MCRFDVYLASLVFRLAQQCPNGQIKTSSHSPGQAILQQFAAIFYFTQTASLLNKRKKESRIIQTFLAWKKRQYSENTLLKPLIPIFEPCASP